MCGQNACRSSRVSLEHRRLPYFVPSAGNLGQPGLQALFMPGKQGGFPHVWFCADPGPNIARSGEFWVRSGSCSGTTRDRPRVGPFLKARSKPGHHCGFGTGNSPKNEGIHVTCRPCSVGCTALRARQVTASLLGSSELVPAVPCALFGLPRVWLRVGLGTALAARARDGARAHSDLGPLLVLLVLGRHFRWEVGMKLTKGGLESG